MHLVDSTPVCISCIQYSLDDLARERDCVSKVEMFVKECKFGSALNLKLQSGSLVRSRRLLLNSIRPHGIMYSVIQSVNDLKGHLLFTASCM